jgi:hypothetical protein
MQILTGLIFVLALLYFWPIGHWFARVVTFLVPAMLLGGVGWLVTGGYGLPSLFGFLVGATLVWPVSGIPIYCYRARGRTTPRL